MLVLKGMSMLCFVVLKVGEVWCWVAEHPLCRERGGCCYEWLAHSLLWLYGAETDDLQGARQWSELPSWVQSLSSVCLCWEVPTSQDTGDGLSFLYTSHNDSRSELKTNICPICLTVSKQQQCGVKVPLSAGKWCNTCMCSNQSYYLFRKLYTEL